MNALTDSRTRRTTVVAPPPMPSGWFVVARARDLRPGSQTTIRRFGTELVLFRTATGRLALVEATCPHLGAHLGHGGKVVGEHLECPFHGFRFQTDGRCASGGRDTPAPRGARLGSLPLAEREGLVFAWHGAAGEGPTYDLPDLGLADGPRVRLRRAVVDAHPQDTTENSVDLAHFAYVHGYDEVRVVEPLRREGEVLTIAYAATRPTGPFGTPISFTYRVRVTGLGVSQVHVEVDGLATSDLLVLASPVDTGRSEVWLGARVQLARRALPIPGLRTLVDELASSIMASILLNDVHQDARIWSHKRWVHPPRLSAADGPIGPYRAWAGRFYPTPDDGQVASCAEVTPCR
ncbi:MAG: Rieske 2Fe-2S domain-containing protein [Alphaproteobacteria bacterium]|nr:Rieske 2Fe-2S domain-containing protein [Alphaproteobacteria bacterium]